MDIFYIHESVYKKKFINFRENFVGFDAYNKGQKHSIAEHYKKKVDKGILWEYEINLI